MKHVLRIVLWALALAALPSLAGTFADVRVISRSTGQRLPIYAHAGKLYVAGQPGERYSVEVANRSRRRILAVVSVDGVNVVTGETASTDQTGYVLSPWQSYQIAGWRKNTEEVAAFYFTELPDSYAARTDRPLHTGVIGVAVFREWIPPRRRPQPHPRSSLGSPAPHTQDAAKAESSDEAAPAAEDAASNAREADAPAASAPIRPREKLATGHGEREPSAVTLVDFRRAAEHPNEMLTLYYDRYENLVARGIIPGTRQLAEPLPFPGEVRFAPDPRS
jgi:hypothetical protein